MYKDRRLLCQHLYEILLRSGKHLDKIGETKPKTASSWEALACNSHHDL